MPTCWIALASGSLPRRSGRGAPLLRTCRFVSRRALRRHSGYTRAKQFKGARREVLRLRTYLRRVIRQIERARPQTEGPLGALLPVARRILLQKSEEGLRMA
jgi:hypothetical protein